MSVSSCTGTVSLKWRSGAAADTVATKAGHYTLHEGVFNIAGLLVRLHISVGVANKLASEETDNFFNLFICRLLTDSLFSLLIVKKCSSQFLIAQTDIFKSLLLSNKQTKTSAFTVKHVIVFDIFALKITQMINIKIVSDLFSLDQLMEKSLLLHLWSIKSAQITSLCKECLPAVLNPLWATFGLISVTSPLPPPPLPVLSTCVEVHCWLISGSPQGLVLQGGHPLFSWPQQRRPD